MMMMMISMLVDIPAKEREKKEQEELTNL